LPKQPHHSLYEPSTMYLIFFRIHKTTKLIGCFMVPATGRIQNSKMAGVTDDDGSVCL